MSGMRPARILINKILGIAGLEMHRVGEGATMFSSLLRARSGGLNPRTVIDVGAASGTEPLLDAFPHSRFLLIEPLEEFRNELEKVAARVDARVVIAAAAARSGQQVINVHPDLVGSSFFIEDEASNVNGVARAVPTVTLDELCRRHQCAPPYLIKIDTQGSELDVLRGAEQALQSTELVILEVSLFEFFKGGPQIQECVSFMKHSGFVVWDLFDLHYRPLDGALAQVDVAFVPEHHALRKVHSYATREQRERLNQSLRGRS